MRARWTQLCVQIALAEMRCAVADADGQGFMVVISQQHSLLESTTAHGIVTAEN